MTLVYYRVANTIMFIYGLYRHFVIIKLIPYIIVTQTPTLWFVLLVLLREPLLRKQAHKLFLGWVINKFLSPIFSMLIFSNVMLNLGSPGTSSALSKIEISNLAQYGAELERAQSRQAPWIFCTQSHLKVHGVRGK